MQSTSDHRSFESILSTVRTWPIRRRIRLVQEVLGTLVVSRATPKKKQPTLSHALGLLATSNPPPSDEEVEQLLEERRRQRYEV